MTETVTLVGAGPGGAELLTCGGGAALRQADAVVYDRLVDESILDLIPKGAERICVGKDVRHGHKGSDTGHDFGLYSGFVFR